VKKTPDAFAIVLVMLFCLILSIFAMAGWYKQSLMMDLSDARCKFCKNLYLTEIALEAGMQFLKNNFDKFLDEKIAEKFPLTFSLYNEPDNSNYAITAKLKVNKSLKNLNKTQSLLVKVDLLEKKDVLCSLGCFLIKNNDVNSDDQSNFTIENYTVGATF
jgi:hypothetical protein